MGLFSFLVSPLSTSGPDTQEISITLLAEHKQAQKNRDFSEHTQGTVFAKIVWKSLKTDGLL